MDNTNHTTLCPLCFRPVTGLNTLECQIDYCSHLLILLKIYSFNVHKSTCQPFNGRCLITNVFTFHDKNSYILNYMSLQLLFISKSYNQYWYTIGAKHTEEFYFILDGRGGGDGRAFPVTIF